jgi:competence protein ComFC
MMLITRGANLCYDSLLALVYPRACGVCSESVESREFGVACANCWSATRTISATDTICWKCGRLSHGVAPPDRREHVRCHRCENDSFTAARACGVYDGALRASVLALKRKPHVSPRLVRLLLEVQQQPPLKDATMIVPVPLHPEREKARGFNQALLLGRDLSQASSIVLNESCLVRTLHTERHRAGLDAVDRHKTVEKAFVVRNPALIKGEKVLLIDDVFTTGATVSSCAGVLLEAGAEGVFVLTVARPSY